MSCGLGGRGARPLTGLSPTTDPLSLDPLFDFGHPAFGGKFLKLQRVVARYDAISRARELNHPLLLLEIRWNVRFAECRTGLMVREIAIQVDVV